MTSLVEDLISILWGFLDPDRLLLMILVLGIVLLFTKYQRLGRLVLVWTSATLLIIACLPIEDWVLLPLETRFPAQPVLLDNIDGIIVLSGAENRAVTMWRNQAALSDNAERLVSFVGLARRYPEARLVVSDGPVVEVEGVTLGAVTAKKLFEDLGLPLARVEFEEQASNTYENGLFSRLLVAPRATEVWVLVTSAFHMPRAVGVWRELGWEIIPYPVDYRASPGWLSFTFNLAGSLQTLSIGVKEWSALLFYRLMGRTSSFFPHPSRIGTTNNESC
jgi:uncharacterized SAM-binding protein YcdF (DUF218 family)